MCNKSYFWQINGLASFTNFKNKWKFNGWRLGWRLGGLASYSNTPLFLCPGLTDPVLRNASSWPSYKKLLKVVDLVFKDLIIQFKNRLLVISWSQNGFNWVPNINANLGLKIFAKILSFNCCFQSVAICP